MNKSLVDYFIWKCFFFEHLESFYSSVWILALEAPLNNAGEDDNARLEIIALNLAEHFKRFVNLPSLPVHLNHDAVRNH